MTNPSQDLIDAVLAMHKADEAYGCGFYNNEEWCAAYMLTKDLAERLQVRSAKADGCFEPFSYTERS